MGKNMQMKKRSDVARRTWDFLRLTVLWTRKGGLIRRRLMMDVNRYLKSLRRNADRSAIYYGERELSFDDTPIFHVKMRRPASMRFKLPRIPCINPQVDFDYDFDDDDDNNISYEDAARKSFLKSAADDETEADYNGDRDRDRDLIPYDEEGVDVRAEEFIARFYDQMKLQRQISYLQYTEMINRGSS